jgi:hypothetical protein
MSAVSMANVAIARRYASRTRGAAPTLEHQAALAEGPADTSPDSAVTAAVKLITTYIPTEILTLYVSATAVLLGGAATGAAPNYTVAWRTFWVFVLLTPLTNWLVFAAKVRVAGRAIPGDPREWPLWEMFAATVAFVSWSAALPSTPFSSFQWYSSDFAGYLVLVVTTFLGLLSSIVHPPAAA